MICPKTGDPCREVRVHGHVQCADCLQVLEGCCEAIPPALDQTLNMRVRWSRFPFDPTKVSK